MKETLKILIMIGILTAGIMAQKMDLLDLTLALTEIEGIADFWWLPPSVVLLQVILYLFALPGSIFIWTVWPLLILTGFALLGILLRKKFFDGRRQAL